MKRDRLLKVHTELTATLRASESWEQSYKKDKDSFKRLVRAEAELQASVLGYLLGLSERIPGMIDWSDKSVAPITAAAIPSKGDDLWKTERQLLTSATHQNILNLMVIGGNAGESIYNRDIGITTLDEFILDAADKYTAKLVSGVTDTTRDGIQRGINQAIAQGESVEATIDRIRGLVASPVRAEMIAQTETVNAYQSGLKYFANTTGAISKTWDVLAGSCDFCEPLAGVTVDIDQEFELESGETIDIPPAHPRCRCGVIYNYAK